MLTEFGHVCRVLRPFDDHSPEGPAVLGRGRPQSFRELSSQRDRRAETGALGDTLHRKLRLLEQPLGETYALPLKPRERRGPELRVEAPR